MAVYIKTFCMETAYKLIQRKLQWDAHLFLSITK